MKPRLLPSLPLLLSALLLLAACEAEDDALPVLEGPPAFEQEGTLTFLRPDGSAAATIAIEIAETQAERARGLMARREMGYDRGMLFLFSEADTTGFWMKNTPMSLDIIFVGPDSQVVSIARRTTPFSEETIYPGAPKQFVVEVRAGFAERFDLTDSTRIRWSRASDAN